jgi:predicted dehydrogenase
MIIAGKKKMLIFDDMENSEKIKIYDCGVEMHSEESRNIAKVQYRIGDMYAPKIVQTEALTLAAEEFLNSIKEERDPLTGGKEGLEVVRLLEAAEISIRDNGKLVEVPLLNTLPDSELNHDIYNISELKEML